jgi:hypothetical protein
MAIPRVRGKRREVRHMLAARSRSLLARYRQAEVNQAQCPIADALSQPKTKTADASPNLP